MGETLMIAEYEEIGKALVELYGDELPHPKREPIRFAYVLKLFMYYNWRK